MHPVGDARSGEACQRFQTLGFPANGTVMGSGFRFRNRYGLGRFLAYSSPRRRQLFGDSVEKLELKSGLEWGGRQLGLPYCPFGHLIGLWSPVCGLVGRVSRYAGASILSKGGPWLVSLAMRRRF